MTTPLFTVFTATYNRAHTLPRVRECLRTQTLRDFEWLIVDDGSIDGTRDLVQAWGSNPEVPTRYVYQSNQGKGAAVNRGLVEARGELFLILDSDDTCTPDALERFRDIWESIPHERRHEFSGVTVHCVDPAGRIVGDQFPGDPVDAHPHEILRVRGEKWGFHRTAVLREFPYPVFPGERFQPEATVWNRVGRHYLIRFRNVALRHYTPGSRGITANVRRLLMNSPRGSTLYFGELLGLPIPWRRRWRAAVHYGRYALHAGRSFKQILTQAPRRGLVAVFLPAAWLAWLGDVVRFRWIGSGRTSRSSEAPV